MSDLKILWIGPFFSDKALTEKRAANQAAAKWSRGLLRGLERLGCELKVVNHCPEQVWPKGRVFWQNNARKWFLDWYPCARIPYLNVPRIREMWLCWAYGRAVRKMIALWRPDVLLAYNSFHAYNEVAMKVAKTLGVKCVPIILDGDDPRRDNWAWLRRTTKNADGIVFLSWWMKEHCPIDVPVLHLDGGADAFKGSLPLGRAAGQKPSSFSLVHTGALDYWRGLDFMKKVVRMCGRQDVRFIFCGKCDRDAMRKEFSNDSRVEICGFLPNDDVDKICRAATLFLNVRDPNVGDNIVNYPSKVPQYLAWGKPVISTWLKSFSPDHRDVLCVAESNTPEAFLSKIDEVISWDASVYEKHFNKVKLWYNTYKDWRVQAGRLVDFMETLK